MSDSLPGIVIIHQFTNRSETIGVIRKTLKKEFKYRQIFKNKDKNC